jgi:hypothetical protein
MGYHSSSVFKGLQVGVNTQMKEIVVPFMIEMHYFIHQTNLVAFVLLKLNLVVSLESLLPYLESLYEFFSFTQ